MSAQARLRQLLGELDAHCPGEAGHGERVAVYAVAVGEKLLLSDEQLLNLRLASALHDIGKLMLPIELLWKTGRLDGTDVLEIRKHPTLGAEILTQVPELGHLAGIVVAHHERMDGTGYPNRIHGAEIPLESRIIAVAEAFDVLTTEAKWRKPLLEQEAIAELRRNAGLQFDSSCVGALIEVQPLIQPL